MIFDNQTNLSEQDSILDRFKLWSYRVLIVAILLECVFFWSAATFTALVVIAVGWIVFTKVILQSDILANFPLSTFLVFGFTVTQLYFPLLFTLIEQKPVLYNLELPYEVFFHILLDFTVLLIAHKVYRANSQYVLQSIKSLLIRSDFFAVPSNKQMWFIGFIGLGAIFYTYIYTKSATVMTGTVVNKFIEALIPFCYVPFFIPLGKLYGNNDPVQKKTLFFLVLFVIALLGISIARNSRAAFMYGFTSVGLGYLLGLLLGFYKAPSLSLVKVIGLLITYWLFNSPLADLGTAMVIVRSQRADVSSSELMQLTLNTFSDKTAIQRRRLEDRATNDFTWDENYLNDIFLARFCNIKYNDLSLVQSHKLLSNSDDYYNFTLSRILTVFPAPIVEKLDLIKDKKTAVNFSFGDYIYAKAGRGSEILGANLVGHLDGTGMAAFGWWYLLFLGVGIIPVYLLVDVFFLYKQVIVDSDANLHLWQGQFSLCGLLALTAIFQFLPAESVIITVMFTFRVWIQMVFLYLLIYRLSNLVNRF